MDVATLFMIIQTVLAGVDGFYNPNDGDYPLIKGSQAIFFIYNSERSFGLLASGKIKGLAYAYGNSADSALENTIFIDYEIINRSVITLENT